MFKGEKTVLFYVGLIVLGYSVYQFFSAVWQIVSSYILYPGSALVDFYLIQTFVPAFVQGIIFLIIGLFIMKVGTVKKELKAET